LKILYNSNFQYFSRIFLASINSDFYKGLFIIYFTNIELKLLIVKSGLRYFIRGPDHLDHLLDYFVDCVSPFVTSGITNKVSTGDRKSGRLPENKITSCCIVGAEPGNRQLFESLPLDFTRKTLPRNIPGLISRHK